MSAVQAIKCTNCASPLKLLGGGRVATVTCVYCKSVLDLNDNYKVLTHFRAVKDTKRLPFDMGMKGRIKGIEYTIIGRVDYEESGYPYKVWSDFLLFSPLYGYAWLTYEGGILIYSRRNRTFPNVSWQKIGLHHEVVVDGDVYRFYEKYDAKINYVEGELTWIAKRGDRTLFVDLVSPPFGVSIEKSDEGIEYYKSEYVRAEEIYGAFGVGNSERRDEPTAHPLKPFERPLFKALSTLSFWMLLLVGLLFVGVKLDGKGVEVAAFVVENNQTEEHLFTVNSAKYLTTIELRATSAKALNNFNLKLYKEEHLLFSLTKESTYRFEYETQRVSKKMVSWDAYAKEARIYLNLDKLGLYRVVISSVDSTLKSDIVVIVKEECARVNYLLLFAGLLLLLVLLYYILHWRYKRALNADEDSDDDNQEFLTFVGWIVFIGILVVFDANS
jgi:hypothetical protein